jgi:adenosylcobinamide-phosphate synthase
MSFSAILLALLLEQARPLTPGNPVHAALRAWVRWSSRNFDAGRPQHGWLAWGFAVAVPALISLGIHWLLAFTLGWLAAVLWSVVVLYVTLGFRQFSHHFTGIRDALDAGDEEQAREFLAAWEQIDAHDLPRSEIVRHVIEHSVLAAHRHVFGVLAWFSVLAAFGLVPTGAVLYRLAEFVARYWTHQSKIHFQPVSAALQHVAASAWAVIDWLPARITAMGFAVVGSFEEAIDAWRAYAQRAEANNDGVILAATSGAINVRLAGSRMRDADGESNADPSPNRQEPELAHLRSIVGLVWRSVVMWMVLLALLTLARLLG